MRKLLWVLLALALVAAACAGGDSGDSADSVGSDDEAAGEPPAKASDDDVPAEVQAAVSALADEYGDEGAFAVGVFALERGYAVPQVIDGAIAGLIQQDGSIEGVEPESPALGVIIIDPDSVVFASYGPEPEVEPLHIEEFRRRWAEKAAEIGLSETTPSEVAGMEMLELILVFLKTEPLLTLEDVIAMILLGLNIDEYKTLLDEEILASRDGSASGQSQTGTEAEPQESVESEPSDKPAEADDDDQNPVYRGPADIVLVYDDSDGQDPYWGTFQCDTQTEARLTIRPDGAAVLEVDWTMWVNAPGTSDVGCRELPDTPLVIDGVWTSVFEGTWEGSDFFVAIREPINNGPAPVEGFFNESFAVATVNLTYTPPPSGLPITAAVNLDLDLVNG